MGMSRTEIEKKIETIEAERKFFDSALKVGICPGCGADLGRKDITETDEDHDTPTRIKYTCVCGFSHERVE